MSGRTYHDPWVKKAKWLTQALIISGTLNVGLLSTFIYFTISENTRAIHRQYDTKKSLVDLKEHRGLEELLNKYSTLSFQDLILRVGNRDHVESGYTKRDLALACLVAFHHFNLEKALGEKPTQTREIRFISPKTQKEVALDVFTGLANDQFEAIVHFAKTEKWPLTSEGLFLEIQGRKPPYDPTLLEAFYLTSEFHFVNLLFSKTGIAMKKEYIVNLLSGGKWPSVCELADYLRSNGEFKIEERRRFLLELVQEGSRLAAKILLQSDQEYCLKALDNEQILALCNLLGEKTSTSFLKELLQDPRNDEIWKKAACLLYDQAAEDIPERLDLEKARRRFLELKGETKVIATKYTPKKEKKVYVVAPGDSLWKIANRHAITIKALKEVNHLKSDHLTVGQKLILPNSKD